MRKITDRNEYAQLLEGAEPAKLSPMLSGGNGNRKSVEEAYTLTDGSRLEVCVNHWGHWETWLHSPEDVRTHLTKPLPRNIYQEW